LESLAVCQVLPGKDVTIRSYCPHCMEPIEVRTRDGQILSRKPESIVLHFAVPLRKWFEDLVFA